MVGLADRPFLMALFNLPALWLCSWFGARFAHLAPRTKEGRDELGVVLAASLTLLGLIVGFTFSMAVNRYDLRKSYEEAEANAIGTEYLRSELLPPAEALATKALLRQYLEQRVLFYEARGGTALGPINARTGELQEQLWTRVRDAAGPQPTAITALVISGMNDVINSQGYTQFAWWNRIPSSAWELVLVIAALCSGLLGFTAPHLRTRPLLFSVLPLVVTIALFLIADIDSPRAGTIHVVPQNLLALAATLR